MKIGFIGIGHMGAGMASRLLAAGHTVTVYNRTRSRAEPLGSQGARVADSVRDAAADAEVVITMVADDRALEEIVFPPGDALHALPVGATHVSMSTISVELSRRLAAAHRESKQHYLSATVFGRPDAAADGKLFVVAAGDAEQVRRCQPLFETLGQKVFNAGTDAPAANVIKLAGNFMVTSVIESLSECIALARKSNVDPHLLLDVLTGSLFSAPVYKTYGDIVIEEKFEPAAFKLPLGMKDNTLVLEAAQSASVPMPVASLVHDRFVTAMATGLGESDWSAIARVTFRNAGL